MTSTPTSSPTSKTLLTRGAESAHATAFRAARRSLLRALVRAEGGLSVLDPTGSLLRTFRSRGTLRTRQRRLAAALRTADYRSPRLRSAALSLMQTLPGPEARHLAGLLAAMDRPWQALFDANQRLVMSQALKLSGRRTDLDDLLQEGRLGLLRAIELFDPRLGFRFSTYACKPIREFIQNTLDEQHRPIRPGSGRIRVERKLHHAERELEGTLLRQPKEEELAARMGWTLAELMSHRACTPRVSSLDLLDESGKQRRDLEPKDPHTPLEAALSQLMAGAVRASLPALPQRERKVILLRYGLGPSGAEMTHKAIGALLGVSGARVQQLENQALKRLRARIEPTSGRQIA